MSTVKHYVPKDLQPILQMIEQTWQAKGELQPMAFLGGQSGVGVVPMQFTTPESKDFYARAICELVETLPAQWVAFVLESWALNIKDKTPDEAQKLYQDWAASGKSLAEHPNRMEVIMVTYENPTGCKLGIIKIKRESDGKATLEPIEWQDSAENSGRFAGFFKKATS